jgi:hypothetical protein
MLHDLNKKGRQCCSPNTHILFFAHTPLACAPISDLIFALLRGQIVDARLIHKQTQPILSKKSEL